MRVIRKGPAVKTTVDDAIDQCAAVSNLRDSIEESRNRAEQAADEKHKRAHLQKGIVFDKCLPDHAFAGIDPSRNLGLQNLRRYFELIVFQSYLQSTELDTMDSLPSIEKFVNDHPGACQTYIGGSPVN